MNSAMIPNYSGEVKFSVPTTHVALRRIVAHPDSDGCVFTYEQLAACGVRPPADTKGTHVFQICQGELCANANEAFASYVLRNCGTEWVALDAEDNDA